MVSSVYISGLSSYSFCGFSKKVSVADPLVKTQLQFLRQPGIQRYILLQQRDPFLMEHRWLLGLCAKQRLQSLPDHGA